MRSVSPLLLQKISRDARFGTHYLYFSGEQDRFPYADAGEERHASFSLLSSLPREVPQHSKEKKPTPLFTLMLADIFRFMAPAGKIFLSQVHLNFLPDVTRNQLSTLVVT